MTTTLRLWLDVARDWAAAAPRAARVRRGLGRLHPPRRPLRGGTDRRRVLPARRRRVHPGRRLGHDRLLQRRPAARHVGRRRPAAAVQRRLPCRTSLPRPRSAAATVRPTPAHPAHRQLVRQPHRSKENHDHDSSSRFRRHGSRRSLLLGGAALGGSFAAQRLHRRQPDTGLLRSQRTAATLTLQSSLSDPKPKAALESIVKDYTGPKTGHPQHGRHRAVPDPAADLPTSANPPDVLTWYAGSVARDYASKDLLLDLSDMWTGDGACAELLRRPQGAVHRRRRQADLRADQLLLVGRLLPQVHLRQVGRARSPRPGTSSWRCATTLKSKGVHADRRSAPAPPRGWPRAGSTTSNIRINGAPVPPRAARRQALASTTPRSKQGLGPLAEAAALLRPQGQVLRLAGGRRRRWCSKKAGMFLIGAFFTDASRPTPSTTSTSSGSDHRPGHARRRGGADRRLLRQREDQERRPAPRTC